MSRDHERQRRSMPPQWSPRDARLAVCYARVRAQHMGASHVTYEALEELLQRLRDGDEEGRLPGEDGYVEPQLTGIV